MSEEMSDEEFLSYCDWHADTPRCGFVPRQIARLLKLSGAEEEEVKRWEDTPNAVINCDSDQIHALVEMARNA